MALPPNLMTTHFPWCRVSHGSASMSVRALGSAVCLRVAVRAGGAGAAGAGWVGAGGADTSGWIGTSGRAGAAADGGAGAGGPGRGGFGGGVAHDEYALFSWT